MSQPGNQDSSKAIFKLSARADGRSSPGEIPKNETPKTGLSEKNWVVVSKIFNFHPYLGKIPILTTIFQKGLKPPTRKELNGWFYFVKSSHQEFPKKNQN